jgi:hypothetical protein
MAVSYIAPLIWRTGLNERFLPGNGKKEEIGMGYIKKPELRSLKRIKRTCLKCDRKFVAEGKFNRICGPCTESNKQIIFGRYIVGNIKARRSMR